MSEDTPGNLTPDGDSYTLPSPRHRRSDSATLMPTSPLAALQGLFNLRTISFDAVLAAQRKVSISNAAAFADDVFSAPLQVGGTAGLPCVPLHRLCMA